MRKELKKENKLGFYNTILKDVLKSVSEDKVEETKASYPDSGSVKDSRDGSPDESEEVIEGEGDGGLKLQVGTPLLST